MAAPLKLDGNKLLFHLDEVEQWLAGKPFLPLYLSISPVQNCNFHCSFCAFGDRDRTAARLSREQISRLAAELRGTTVKAVLFSGECEPLLHPELPELAEAFVANGIETALNTNGSLLNDAASVKLVRTLTWIRVSVNAGTSGTYAKVHGVSEDTFERVLQNLEALVRRKIEARSKITVGVQCVLLKQNRDEIVALARRLKDIGVDYFALKPYLPAPGSPLGPEEAVYDTAYLQEALGSLDTPEFRCRVRDSMVLPERSYRRCLGHAFISELDAKGDLYACGPRLGDRRFWLGNVVESSFKQVWGSERRKEVAAWLEREFDVAECMPACRCDSVNRLLWELRNPPGHVNFI